MIKITITEEMLNEAKRMIPKTKVHRTQASNIDTLTGNIGEFIFAQWFYEDWKKNSVGNSKGKIDFNNIEVKTSAYPFSEKLNLLVRQDYAQKRKPDYYVQIIIDIKCKNTNNIEAGTIAYICGYATYEEVDNAPLKDFGSKFGNAGGYQYHYIKISQLHPIEEIKTSI